MVPNKESRAMRGLSEMLSGQRLALVTEEVLAGSRGVVFFVVAREQGCQTLVDVFHISPHGVL